MLVSILFYIIAEQMFNVPVVPHLNLIFSFPKLFDSKEQVVKENNAWVGCTGLPATTVEDKYLILMLESFDNRLSIPKRTRVNNLVEKLHNDKKIKFKDRLATARKITAGWTYV